MEDRGDFKSRIISSQKLGKRRAKAGRGRGKVDLIELHRKIGEARKQRRPAKYRWIKGGLFALIAILCFFQLGYLIAALSIPIWAKVLLFALIAVLGFVSGHFVAALLH
jgi:hypothetical protein